MLKNQPEHNHKPIINKRQLAWRAIDGELIIVHIPSNKVYRLNPMGLYIWDRIDGQKNLSDIIGLIGAEFDASPENIEKDVLEFTDNLLKHNIIKYA
ncbi:MAG: PqqD family protein [Candidatus Omnitrophica bacterium]|nr:PqqD family protein [Candidatus Omnitrophota bacterium]